MTDRKAEIRARLETATPGPWFANDTHINGMESQRNIDNAANEQVCWTTRGWPNGVAVANAILIANAPTDIAWLLEELERAKLENQSLGRAGGYG